MLIPYSADYEQKISNGTIEKSVPSALNKIIKSCYDTLDLIH